jgi:hypothetical protein
MSLQKGALKMKKIYLTGGLVIAILLLAACSLQPAEPAAPPTQPADQEPAAPTDAAAESIFGPGTLTMEIPVGWNVAGPMTITDDSGRSYQSWALGEDPTSSGGPGTSHVIIADPAEWTPEDLALVQCSTCPNNGFDEVTIGGKQGLRTEIGGGGVPFMTTWYFVENQGNLIAFAIHDPQTIEPLESVITSIRFE